MKDLDSNKDDKLDFEEFLPLVAGLSLACEKCYLLHENKGKKWWANACENKNAVSLERKIWKCKCISNKTAVT